MNTSRIIRLIDKLLAKVGLQRRINWKTSKWRIPITKLADRLLLKQGLVKAEWHDTDLAEQAQWLEDKLKAERKRIICLEDKLLAFMEHLQLARVNVQRFGRCDQLQVTVMIDEAFINEMRTFGSIDGERVEWLMRPLTQYLYRELLRASREQSRQSYRDRMHRDRENMILSPSDKMR